MNTKLMDIRCQRIVTQAHAKRIIRAKYPGARFLEIWEQVYHGDD